MFSNETDIEIKIDTLFDYFGDYSIIFISFFGLCYRNSLCSGFINNVSYFFLIKYGLRKVGLLGLIFKALKLFMLYFSII